jgi:NADH-quinone oxidoreductase subunit A
MLDSTTIVAYLALFFAVGMAFLFVNLLVGRFVRPENPHAAKTEIYECGEPTIGSSFVQFDIRFYVVALLFIIFDVEVAFFFPWATVFGKATHLMSDKVVAVESVGDTGENLQLTPAGEGLLLEMGVANPTAPTATDSGRPITTPEQANAAVRGMAGSLARMSIIDIGVFFAVLLVGFAYVWKRGDLDWVRAISRQHTGQVERAASADAADEEVVLSA